MQRGLWHQVGAAAKDHLSSGRRWAQNTNWSSGGFAWGVFLQRRLLSCDPGRSTFFQASSSDCSQIVNGNLLSYLTVST